MSDSGASPEAVGGLAAGAAESSGRLSLRARRVLLILSGVLVASGSVAGFYSVAEGVDERVAVTVAAVDIPAGRTVAASDLASVLAHPGSIPHFRWFQGSVSGLEGLVAVHDIAAGSLLGPSMFVAHRPRRPVRGRLSALVPTVPAGDEAGLRLAGMTPREYSAQRLGGSLVGAVSGLAISAATQAALPGAVLWTVAAAVGGWLLPVLGARDAARKARDDFDQVVRVWIALVAQQVRAGADPSAAMLDAATAGRRPAWGVLRRFLLAAQHQRRPAWEGLADAVDRYGLHSLAPTVSALGLAARRGTRVADAVLVAAENLWRESLSQQRERAARRAQIIVVPATGVALALAAILVYPPFTALTGGGLAGAP